MIALTDSEITTSVQTGASDAGDITIGSPEFMILNNSRIVANAYQGEGGNISIVAGVFLADPYSVVDASSTLGIDGVVTIDAPINNITGSLVALDDFLDAVKLLSEPCMARVTAGRYSSLVIGARGGLPVEPGRLLPSPLPQLVNTLEM
jgi:large exoprotein involved in heme utilization and adhesion